MAYNNSYNNFRPQGKGQFQQRSFRNNNFNNNNQQRFKKSAFTVGKKDDRPFGHGWMKTREGFIKFFLRPQYKDGKVQTYKTDEGKVRIKCIAEVTRGIGNTSNFPAIYYPEKNRFTSEKLNLIFTPNGNGQTRSGKRVRGSIVKLK